MKLREMMETLVAELKKVLVQLQMERKEYIFTHNPQSPLLHIAGIIFQLEMLINEIED